MRTESVHVTEVRVGDVIRDPRGGGSWRTVEELGYGPCSRNDESGHCWEVFAFIGPVVNPADARVITDTHPDFDRFVFREDERVIRKVVSASALRLTPVPERRRVHLLRDR
ncbi:hypothetical protein [Nocardia abscessus]|uniref:hypothetical protein n=1 Tax=Nocardia abscessus TaxID=120957 RepID=UPI002454781C|nr:hypothetical protein [Nocardia abscessus]